MHKCIYEIVKILSGAWDEERCDSPAKRLCSTICRSVQGETLWYYQTRKIFQVNFFIFGFMRKESDYWPKTLIYNPYIFVAFLCYVKYQLKNPALPVEKKNNLFFFYVTPRLPIPSNNFAENPRKFPGIFHGKIRWKCRQLFPGIYRYQFRGPRSEEFLVTVSKEFLVTNSREFLVTNSSEKTRENL